MMKSFIVFCVLLLSFSSLQAEIEVKKFNNLQQEQRYKYITDELRCLVCQNQNIASSNAGLAKDLREKVYEMILSGKNNEEILDFMVMRYGDFVLYSPPFKTSTFLLWVGPFIILILGLIVLVRFIRQRKKVVIKQLNSSDKEKLKQLMNKESTSKEQSK